MKKTTILAATIAAAGAVAAAPIAAAEVGAAPVGPQTTELGKQAELVTGAVTQGWTVSGLQPSSDQIPYQVRGTLWEATATDQAIQGSAQPIVSNFNARAADGQTYRALFQVASPQGVNPGAIAQGQQTSGKLYFDVTGAQPDSVVYNDGARDALLWVKPAATPSTSGSGAASSYPSTSYPSAAVPQGSGTAAAPAAAGAEAAAPGAPVPASAEGAPVPGSTGTPIPEGSAGTPVPAGSAGTPVPAGSSGTPIPAGTQPAPAAPPASPAPAAPPATAAPQPVSNADPAEVPHYVPAPTTTAVPQP